MEILKQTDANKLIKEYSRRDLKEALRSIKPTKEVAIKGIHFISALKAVEKELKTKFYDYLDNRCGGDEVCEEHYDEETGLGVKRVVRESKSYPTTEKMESIKAQIEELEDSIEEIEAVKAIRAKIESLEDEYEHEKLSQTPEIKQSRYYKASV